VALSRQVTNHLHQNRNIPMPASAPTYLAIALLLGALPLLAACNTTAGAGKDMSAAGAAVTESARKNAP